MLFVLYGNCQMKAISEIFMKYIPGHEYTYITNYTLIKDVNKDSKISDDMLTLLNNADVFIYQPISGYYCFDTDNIIKCIRPNCIKISFAYLYFLGYFPDYIDDKNNAKTITEEFPYGLYPYGYESIRKLLFCGKNIWEIISIVQDPEFLTSEYVINKMNYGLKTLEEKESGTTIKLSEFIRNNYKTMRLFHTVNHPTNALLNELVNNILDVLGMKHVLILDDDEYIGAHSSIIYPVVSKCLELEFEINMEQNAFFITNYIECLYPNYYYYSSL